MVVPRLKGLALLVGVSSSLGLFSCSFVIDFDQVQCKKSSDCAKLGRAFTHGKCVEGLCEEGPECLKNDECSATEGCVEGACVDRWACLDDKVPAPKKNVSFAVPVLTIFGMPLPGTSVKLCASVDTECASPTAELTAGEDGMVVFEVTPTFQGYLETSAQGFFPQVNFLPEQLTEPSFLPPISLSPTEIIEGLAQQVGAAADPKRGHLVVSVASCIGAAPDLVITSGKTDEKTIPYYVSASVPAPDRTFTTDEGSGGFLNLVTGTGELTVSMKDGDELFSRNIFVRPGTISTVHFQPPALALAQSQ